MKPTNRRVVLRTLLMSLVIIAVTATALAASDLFSGEMLPKVYPQGVPTAQEELRAMTVRTQDNADFPTEPGLSTAALKSQLEEIASFANTYGYNAIFFEAAPEGDALYRSAQLPASAYWTGAQGGFTFFDPLKYLTNISKEYGIQVYAVIDPFDIADSGLSDKSPAQKNPEWVVNGYLNPAELGVQKLLGKVADELTSHYDIAGVVLSGVDSAIFDSVEHYETCIAQITATMQNAIHNRDTQRLGMVVNASAIAPDSPRDLFTTPIQKGDLNFVVTSADMGTDDDALTAQLDAWNTLCTKYSDADKPVSFYPMHVANDDTAFDHTIDNNRYFERAAGAGGIVISNYGTLHTEARTAAYSLAASFAQTEPAVTPDLSYPQSFTITRPTDTLTVSSDTASYFITGTSDPSKPLQYNGAEVDRKTENGLWGVLVEVPYGTTSYSFAQGGVAKTATIVRNKPSTTPAQISTISKTSAYPANPEAVLDGKELKLSCTAPAGGSVTASVGGLSQTLTQVAATSQNGVAVVYQATLDLSSLAVPGQVRKLGPVTYKLNYAGMNSTQQSAGEVYVTGAGALPVAKMKTFIVPVNKNAADDGAYQTILKKDCIDYIVENAGGGYYKLASGGYVLKSAVDIPEGSVSAKNTISSMLLEKTAKGEKLILTGTARPAFSGSIDDGRVTLVLHNIAGFENMNTSMLESDLCSSITSEIGEDNTVTLTFQLNEDAALLGWDVQFEGNDMTVYLKKKPVLHADTATPLSDVSVVLDPGHGGSDPGALGVPGELGAMEKSLNLANAYALQNRLQALGATVHLVQEDATMTLNDRMELSQKYDADLFISCHHNSIAESVDSNGVTGIEVYYYNDQSKEFAEQIGGNLSDVTGRKLRFVEQSWYRVTMMTACPAVLVESGYLCNPAEYERLVTPYAMYQYGNAVADAVLAYLA